GRPEQVTRRSEASAAFDPTADVGTWEWTGATSVDAGEAREDGLPSGALRQVRQWSIESSRECVKILDLDGRLIYINPAGLERLGVEDARDLLHRPLVDLWQEKER